MNRGHDYLSFFNDRHKGDFIFSPHRQRRRWLLAAILILAAAAGFGAWWFTRPPARPASAGTGTTTPAATYLTPQSTTTSSTSPSDATLACSSGSSADWSTFKGNAARTGCSTAPPIATPEILWSTQVGIQGWLDNPVILDGVVYVGSAGQTQFEPDNWDRVWAIDITTGLPKWSFPAGLDVNGVAAAEDMVVATGDEGLVWGINPVTGEEAWSANVGVSVFSNPLVLEDQVVVGDSTGGVSSFDLLSGERRWRETVKGAVRGGAATDGEAVFVAGEEGDVLALDYSGKVVWRRDILPVAGDDARIWAAPTAVEGLLVITYVRADIGTDPAVLALDQATGEVRWEAADSAGLKTEWANVRSSPAVVGDVLVFGEAYSGSLVAIGVEDGKTRWAADTGAYCFPAWSSPAVASGQVILPRFDGGIYAVDAASRELSWSLYLGQQDLAGEFPSAFDEDFCQPQPQSGFSVIASPAVSPEGVVVVGTLEGYLIAIGEESAPRAGTRGTTTTVGE